MSLAFSYIICNSCEKRWEIVVVEWPPKVLVCPHCSNVNTLATNINGTLEYRSRGAHKRK